MPGRGQVLEDLDAGDDAQAVGEIALVFEQLDAGPSRSCGPHMRTSALMATPNLSRSGLLLVAFLGACTDFEDPNYYIESFSPVLYFGLELPRQANAAFVRWATTKPTNSERMPQPRLRVITWANEGGRAQDGTIGLRVLDSPVERSDVLLWAANATPPSGLLGGFSAFDKIAVELRPEMYTVGYSTTPLMGGNYATVDIAGAGVTEFGPWINALLEFVVQCRGDIGQIVDCHGLNYVLAPLLELRYSSPEGAVMADAPIKTYEVILNPELYIARTSIGWLYRTLQPDESKIKPIDAYPTYGPFDTPEEAARDAAERLSLRPSWMWEPVPDEEMSEALRNTEMPRLGRALHEAINLRKR